ILLNRIIDRSLRDLRMLRSTIHGHAYFAAGLPWFGTLFGRDSLITALQTLAFNPGIAAQTLRVLARYQGEKVDPWRDEEPGKILHEFRVGELANLNEVPYTPYYGSIDATPLFLILMARYLAWTADLQLFSDLRENVERALQWMARYGDSDGDGYLDYKSRSEKGLVNQGWKDSGDAIVNSDGSLAEPPIALVEVQGYAYLAKQALADLFARVGDQDRANQLRHEAEDLRERFNRDFWMADKGFYALALQKGGRKADVVASNPGQALWTGIADHDKAVTTARRLVADDVYSGWGVRTLSARERRFNPLGYHLGTVWPHDNSIIAAGFRRYGLRDETMKVFNGITQAAMYFEHNRLPEVFAGYDREDYGVPVHYPVACHPQAWAAGAVPFLLTTLLGLRPEAFDKRLRIYHPLLPEYVHFLRLKNLRVGDARADLSFERAPSGGIAVNVLSVSGELDVVVEPGLPSP
ncbi:MAG: amylo-alpha-1,6-glucosidase, partial [Thermomicrobiaceae bacterium]|nr:amylo-alpha-1,6-glucosidase [Thermomicrobiaceae bacterium]